ncbi:MAG: FAD-dependent oxidoreductase, partial [Spirochaetaceae bacterium]
MSNAQVVYDYDLVVIGAGPGGYVAAIRAGQLGLKCLLIEKDQIGGVCLNVGCIPSKSLIHQASVFSKRKELMAMGCDVNDAGFDYSKVFNASRQTVSRLNKGVTALLKKNGVTCVFGQAVLQNEHTVIIKQQDGEQTASGKNILLATGSSPRELAGFPIDEERILSSSGILLMQKLPASLIILGAGAIGMEFAYIMSSFGVKVSVVEMESRVLPYEDSDSAAVIANQLSRQGVDIFCGHKASELASVDQLLLTIQDKDGQTKQLQAEKMLIAIGRVPNTAGLGLEKLNVKLDENGYVQTNSFGKSSVDS